MLIDDFGLICGEIDLHGCGDRGERRRLIALAIGRRSTDDPDGWARVAERIAAIGPDFATLLHFIRAEPALLPAYFAVEARVRRLIDGCGPAVRMLVRYAHDLAAARPPSIVALTNDERLRVRLYELSLLAGALEPSSIGAAADDLLLRTPDGIAALAFLLLRMGRASPYRLPLHLISRWPEGRRRVFFWRYMAFTYHRQIAPFADPAKTFRLSLGAEERARAARLQMPGQFAVAKRTGLEFLRPTVQRVGFPATRWFDISLTLPRLARMTTADSWTALVRKTLGAVQAQDYLSRGSTLRMMTRRFGADGILHLYEHYGVRSLFEQTLENGARSSKKILKNFSGRYPQILPPQALERVEAFTADRDTFITLVNEYLLGRAPGANGDVAEIAAAAFETPASVMRAVVECETGRRLMAALSQFKIKHDINLLRSIAFRGGAQASPTGLDGYLYELRNAFVLELAIHVARRGGRSLGKAAQRRLFDRFFVLEFESDRLPPERIESARQQLRSRAVSRINAALEAQGDAQRLEAQDLDALARDWRDTEPVVTLLARLSDPGVGAARAWTRPARPARREGRGATQVHGVQVRRSLRTAAARLPERSAARDLENAARAGAGRRRGAAGQSAATQGADEPLDADLGAPLRPRAWRPRASDARASRRNGGARQRGDQGRSGGRRRARPRRPRFAGGDSGMRARLLPRHRGAAQRSDSRRLRAAQRGAGHARAFAHRFRRRQRERGLSERACGSPADRAGDSEGPARRRDDLEGHRGDGLRLFAAPHADHRRSRQYGLLPQLSERQPHQRAAGLCRGRQHPGAGELATEAGAFRQRA